MEPISPEQNTGTDDGEQQAGMPALQTAPLYDADAEQKMPFQTERRVSGVAKLYNVAHIFGPIKDADVFEYDRRRNQTIGEANEQEIDQTGGTSIEAKKGAGAAINYWDSTGARAEGYAGKVSNADKVFAVSNLLFGFEFNELPMASADELCPEEDDAASTYSARCIFSGHVVEVSASLRPATTEELTDFQRLKSRTIMVRGQQFGKQDLIIPSQSKRLAELFDLMVVGTTGYAGRVPGHHKVAYANRHLSSQQKAITGN